MNQHETNPGFPATPKKTGYGGRIMSTVRMPRHLAVLLVLLLPTLYGKDGLPYFAMKENGDITQFFRIDITFVFVNSAGKTISIDKAVVTTSVGGAAENLAEQLKENGDVKGEYKFSAVFSDKTGVWYVFGQPLAGKTPKPVKDKMKITNGVPGISDKMQPVGVAPGVDPAPGTAAFDVTGTATGSPGGAIYIGVDGLIVSCPTADSSGPKSVETIMLELLEGLWQLGFSNAYIDSSTGLLTVPDVSAGGVTPTDLDETDVGAYFLSTDPGLGGEADMSSASTQNPAPAARGTVSAPSRVKAGSTFMVCISNFPGKSTINVSLNGQALGTISTNAGGSGCSTFTAPNNPVGVPLLLTAAGGNPMTYGYAWVTLFN